MRTRSQSSAATWLKTFHPRKINGNEVSKLKSLSLTVAQRQKSYLIGSPQLRKFWNSSTDGAPTMPMYVRCPTGDNASGDHIACPIFISFFCAIRNMAEKVPSFKIGGTLWFTDLTTADTTYILPLLTAITFIIMVESNMQEGMEGNPVAGTMKKFSRIIAFLSIPILMGIEKKLILVYVCSCRKK
ncbi:hypothetical protein Bca52824_081308 [Brassica carinata]|uniref:Uncharacterized protein n=1 Tax=Brassica carinata TaxID=52824 RepID=A0A8X7PI76_BRACI|nr:hypothetical protein Bca52824_081308 [Brassica carinata]